MVAALIIGALSYGIYLLLGSRLITLTVITVLLIVLGVISYAAGLPKAKKNIGQLK